MGRAPCCDKANVKKGPWSSEEDAKLKAYIEEHGTGGNWIALPQKIGLKRCGKSCRLRWLNYLRPNIRHGGFSEEEDNIICSLYISIGSRWSIIAAQLPGRTDNDIKNYWNTRLKKKLLGRRKESQARRFSSHGQEPSDTVDGMTQNNKPPPALSASALERMQLHMQLQGLNPFSFYNDPALWPRCHPLGDRIVLQTQHDNERIQAIDQVVQQQLVSSPRALFQSNPEATNSMVESHQGDRFDSSSLNGFSSPSNSTGFGIEQSNAGFGSIVALQGELGDVLSGKNVCFEGKENEQTSHVDCFTEMDGESENMSWWSNNGLEENLASCSWDSTSALLHESMFQEYILGFDL